MSYYGSVDYGFEVAKGNVTGVSAVNKFGQNAEIDLNVTADIWSGGKTVGALPAGSSLLWVAPTQARQHTIASTSANDTSGGTGARTVQIYGLTSWTAAEVNETVTLVTASPPLTTNSYVIIHRMKVLTTGSNATPNIGTITATAASDSTVTARIEATEGQTQMAVYGIPSTQTLYITELGASTNKAGGATGLMDLDLLVNQEPQTQRLAFRHNHHFGLLTVGSSSERVNFVPPKAIAGPAIIKIQGTSGANDMSVSAWFNGEVRTN